MPSPSMLAHWEGLILVGGLLAIVFWKLISGGVVLDQLFEGDIQDPDAEDGFSTHMSAGRIQAFGITIYVAYSYLVQVIQDPTHFPAISDNLIVLLAGSHALYLGGKAQAMLLGPVRNILK